MLIRCVRRRSSLRSIQAIGVLLYDVATVACLIGFAVVGGVMTLLRVIVMVRRTRSHLIIYSIRIDSIILGVDATAAF